MAASGTAQTPTGKSTCYGNWADGALEGGVQVTPSGNNFEIVRYKNAPSRTFVHSGVKKTLDDTFSALDTALPDAKFLIGETGLEHGGILSGHHTHRNGLSVDLFVPVRDATDNSLMLFTNDSRNTYGYKERFDDNTGISGSGRMLIDFEVLAEYLFQLNEAAKRNDLQIHRVILTTAFQSKLMDTKRGPYIRSNLKLWNDPGDRHDNHMHVDFNIDCRAMFRYQKPS